MMEEPGFYRPDDAVEDKKAEERAVPHVLLVQLGATQHAFEMDSREQAVAVARTALTQGWVEIENERVYLLVMAGPNSGLGFLVMSKAEVVGQQIAAARAQAQAAAGSAQKRLVLPNGR
jgi:hypothetical protein